MATLTFDIPNNIATRVMDAICLRHGFSGTFNGQPETKQQFVKRYLIRHIKEEVKSHETFVAQNTAVNTVNTDVETNINIT